MDRALTTRSLAVWWMGVLLVVGGCGGRQQYVVSSLAVQRAGWDTLDVVVQFGQHRFVGGTRPLAPKAQMVYLFNAVYDTLYAGDSLVVPVPDYRLGDGERLLVEVCGAFEAQTVCAQEAVTASPKRLRLDHDISYPEGGAFEKGSYDLHFVAERQHFDTGRWERIDPQAQIGGYLLAYVGDDEQEAVKVPFSRHRGRFNLAGYDHYDDFEYHLKSLLYDEREAQVRFDVYAGLGSQQALRVASVEKKVRKKTQEERLLDVRHFAEQAAEQILDRLDVERSRAYVYVDQWDVNELKNTYAIEVTMQWGRDRFPFGRRYELAGVLEVREDGTQARFRRTHANERIARQWRREVDGAVLDLKPLSPYEEEKADLSAEATPEKPQRLAGRW